MSIGALIALVIVIVVIIAAALVGIPILRRRALRRRFGPEYDRLARDVGPRRAQAELAQRQHRVNQLTLRPLSPERRTRYAGAWTAAEERFVDSPAGAAKAAAALVTAVAADRGYPVDDHARLLDDLSVYHADRLDGYRQALKTTENADTAATEELRQALLEYRALLRELLGQPDRTAGDTAAPADATAADANAADAAIIDGTETDSEAGRTTAEATRKE